MSGSIAPYVAKITSEHQGLPKFSAVLAATLQPIADAIDVVASIPGLFDVDLAVGAQLDAVGEWVGVSRFLTEPLTGVYFSFDTAGLGWDQGTWQGPFDPTSGLVALPDDAYRTLIYATIAANQWDGSIPSAYEVWETLFGSASAILIQDGGDMTMTLALIDPTLDAVTVALLTAGLIRLKPAGVRLTTEIPSIPGDPIFGFDVENPSISGFDVGCWPTVLSET